MTFQQLVYFLEVAGTLNFTKASKNLHITQSALSSSIISLERELELPLFVRKSGRNIEMTSYGNALLPLAEENIASMKRIEQTMQSIRKPHAGIVNLAFSYINCWQFVPSMLRSFRNDEPDDSISVNLVVNHTRNNFEEDILLGNIDIAFSCLPHMDGLTSVPFVSQQLYAAVPPEHTLAQRDSVELEDFKDEALIGYHRGRNLDQWVREMYAGKGYHPVMIEYASDWSTQIMKVSAGEGIAIMPKVPAAKDTVLFIPVSGSMGVRTVYMMWAADRRLSPAAAFARDYFLKYRESLKQI